MHIRRADASDATFLTAMLAEAAGPGRGAAGEPHPDVLADPAVAPYIAGWPRPGDLGVIAEEDGVALGAAWARLYDGDRPAYGFVRADVPELAIATVPTRRGAGVGAMLLGELIAVAASAGAPGLSLSVRGDNPAVRLYERHGFVRVGVVGESDTMLLEPLA